MAKLKRLRSAIDTKRVVALGLILCLVIGLGAEERNWREHGYEAWRRMTTGERYAYITGIIVGSYSFGLRYTMDNRDAWGTFPNPYNSMLDTYSNIQLYQLVELVYSRPQYRKVTLPEILCWPEVWYRELGI